VYINGGRINTGKDAVEWAVEVEKLGAGRFFLRAWTVTVRKRI